MLHITLRQLNIFKAVAKNSSFSLAAEELHLSQPAVSMQVKQLEEMLSLSLFEQIGKKIYLTEAGKEVYHYSRIIEQQLFEMESVLNQLKDVSYGKLNISVVSTANYFAPQLLAKFRSLYPHVNVSLNVGNRELVLKHLSDNEIDLAIIGRPPEGIDVTEQAFMENRLVVVCPPDHPLADEKNIPVSQIQNEPFVMREVGSGTRLAMERFFFSHGVKIRMAMEMSTNEAVKQAVQAGMGLGILSLPTVALEIETGRLKTLDVEGFPIIRNWYVVHRKSKRLSNVAQTFKSFLLEQAPSLVMV